MPDKKTDIVKRTGEELIPGLTVKDVQEKYAPGANEKEFALFIDQIKANNLDPRKREVYFVKYGNQPGQMITGYLVYGSRATASGHLDGWDVAVSEGKNGKPESATITIHRKDWKHPFTWTVEATEFNKGQATWNTMPNFMLRKVAIAQGFRIAFPQEIGGLPYTTEEIATISDDKTAEAVMATTQAIDVESEDTTTTIKAKPPKKKNVEVQAEAVEPTPKTPPPEEKQSEQTEAETAEKAPIVKTSKSKGEVSEMIRNKVFAAFKQFGIEKEKIFAIANLVEESDMTETHREWLLEQYHKIRLKKITVEDFGNLKINQ